MASKTKSNFAKKRKKKNPSSSKLDTEQELSLQDVLDVGGDKDDYELIKDVNTTEDFETSVPPASQDEDVGNSEIQKMIKELGFASHQISDVGNLESKNKTTSHVKTKEINQPPERNTSDTLTLNEVLRTKVELSEKLLVRPLPRWFEELHVVDSSTKEELEKTFVDKMFKIAESLWQHEVMIYEKGKEKSKSSDMEWLKTMASSGTLGDKIAALAVQVQESPVHNLKVLDTLLAMSAKKGRRERIMAIDTLKDLWLVNLLPSDRKLRPFSQFPLSDALRKTNKSGRDAWNRKLILWYFEDQLRRRYAAFVIELKALLHDTVENIRDKILGTVYELLAEKPEHEKTMLLYLVDKVGDRSRKIASKAGHFLSCLVQKHPNMKFVITEEVERLLYRPNVGLKAQYFAVCFLNQLILTKQDSALASHLISLYFSLFKAFVNKDEVGGKMLSALLSGVNRAFHYAEDEDDVFSEQVNMLFKLVHVAQFNTSVQALMLLFQVMNSRQSISDRYYQALYTKLLDPKLRTSSKQVMFLNNLYKSLKVDPSLKRTKAFVKRLLQVCSTHVPSFICAVLYLLSEISKVKPGIKILISQPEELEDEHFTDVPDTTEDPRVPDTTQVPTDDATSPKASGHVFVQGSTQGSGYQPSARNPLYCGADSACLWEVIKLSQHYHPSVSRFAQTLLQGKDILYDGDPLLDFTLMRFLDRFVYKNPKQKVAEHGGSLMQPKTVSKRLSEQPVNTPSFLNKNEQNIREDEVFFHRYFKQKAEKEKGTNKTKKVDKEEEEGNGEEENEMFEDENTVMDFASDFKKATTTKPKKKSKSSVEDSEDEEDEDAPSDGGEDFNYEDMDVSDNEFDNLSDEGNVNYTDQDYEKVLLENLSSDEFSDHDSGDESSGRPKEKRKKTKSSNDVSMFAAAEEFAHLLENTAGGAGGADDIDMKGTSVKQQKWEMSRMGNGEDGRRFGRNANKNRKGSFSKKGKQNNRPQSRKKNTGGNRNRKRR